MRRSLLYIAITLAVLAIPMERTDVADLRPVQTVALYKTADGYCLETDTGDIGAGKTVDAAYRDLIDSTPGIIYLDTADYLLISRNAGGAVEELRKYLKKGVRICAVLGQGDLSDVSKFLSVQTGLQPLKRWKTGDPLPVLDCRNPRIKFLQKNGK